MSLENELLDMQRTRWLDVGSGGQFHPQFHYIDIFPIDLVPAAHQDRYHRLDIVNALPEQLDALGTFDLVRMQHTFEHWNFEDGLREVTVIRDDVPPEIIDAALDDVLR